MPSLEGKDPATDSSDLTPFTNTYVRLSGAVSQNEDGNFNLDLLVGKDADTDTRYWVQMTGNTRLTRQLAVTGKEDLTLVNDVTFDATKNEVTTHRQRGDSEPDTTFTLPAFVSLIDYNARDARIITITRADGANITTTTVTLPSVNIPVTPDLELEHA